MMGMLTPVARAAQQAVRRLLATMLSVPLPVGLVVWEATAKMVVERAAVAAEASAWF